MSKPEPFLGRLYVAQSSRVFHIEGIFALNNKSVLEDARFTQAAKIAEGCIF